MTSAASSTWHSLSLIGTIDPDTSEDLSACDLHQPILFLTPSTLRALKLAVGNIVWIRRTDGGANVTATSSAASSFSPCISEPSSFDQRTVVARVHVYNEERDHRFVTWKEKKERAQQQSLDWCIASCALARQFDSTTASALSIQLAPHSSCHPSTLSLAHHLLFRARFISASSSSSQPSSSSSVSLTSHTLLSLLPTLFCNYIVTHGMRVFSDLLKSRHGVEYLEVVEVEKSSMLKGSATFATASSNSISSLSAAYLITRQTTISFTLPSTATTTAASPLSLLPLAFPSSLHAWHARIRKHVYESQEVVEEWTKNVWWTVKRWEKEMLEVKRGHRRNDDSAPISTTATPVSSSITQPTPFLCSLTPRTTLLHGMSGTGKTHLARILSGTSGLSYSFIHASELLTKVEGESEGRMMKLVKVMREKREPCVVVMDEIDSILPKAKLPERSGDSDAGGNGGDDNDDGGDEESHLGNARIEWRMATMLKSLAEECSKVDLPLLKSSSSSFPSASTSMPPPPIFFLFTTSSLSSLNACHMRQSPYIDTEYELRALTVDERQEALQMKMSKWKFREEEAEKASRTSIISRLASSLHGCVGADIDGFIREVFLLTLKRIKGEKQLKRMGSLDGVDQSNVNVTPDEIIMTEEDCHTVLTNFRPSNLQQLEFQLPPDPATSTAVVAASNATSSASPLTPLPLATFLPYFSSLHGITPALQHLYYSFLLPLKQPLLYEHWQRTLGMRASKGVLVYGQSGVGKTTLALCLARACGLNALVVQSTSLVSKLYGESEKILSGLFAKARASAPAVLIFDQLEMIAPKRKGMDGDNRDDDEDEDMDDSNGHEPDAYERMLSVMLVEMDGVMTGGKNEKEMVYVIATSSRPDLVDPALLRPNRLDTHIHLSVPTREEREQILIGLFSRTPLLIEMDAEGRIIIPAQQSLMWMIQLSEEVKKKVVEWEWTRKEDLELMIHSVDDEKGSAASTTAACSSSSSPSPISPRRLFFHILSHLTPSYSGADLSSLHRESALHSLRHDLTTQGVRTWTDCLCGVVRGMKGSLKEVEYHPFGARESVSAFASSAASSSALTAASSSSKPLFRKMDTQQIVDRNLHSRSGVGVIQHETVLPTSLAPQLPTAPFEFTLPATATSSLPQPGAATSPFTFDSTSAFTFTGTSEATEAASQAPKRPSELEARRERRADMRDRRL